LRSMELFEVRLENNIVKIVVNSPLFSQTWTYLEESIEYETKNWRIQEGFTTYLFNKIQCHCQGNGR
jgi:hypothetical protein